MKKKKVPFPVEEVPKTTERKVTHGSDTDLVNKLCGQYLNDVIEEQLIYHTTVNLKGIPTKGDTPSDYTKTQKVQATSNPFTPEYAMEPSNNPAAGIDPNETVFIVHPDLTGSANSIMQTLESAPPITVQKQVSRRSTKIKRTQSVPSKYITVPNYEFFQDFSTMETPVKEYTEPEVGKCYFISSLNHTGIYLLKEYAPGITGQCSLIKVNSTASNKPGNKRYKLINHVPSFVMKNSKKIDDYFSYTFILKSVENSIKAFGHESLYNKLSIGNSLPVIRMETDSALVLTDGTTIRNLLWIKDLEISKEQFRIHPDDVRIIKPNIKGFHCKKRKSILVKDRVIFKKNKKISHINVGSEGEVISIMKNPYRESQVKYAKVRIKDKVVTTLASNLKRL